MTTMNSQFVSKIDTQLEFALSNLKVNTSMWTKAALQLHKRWLLFDQGHLFWNPENNEVEVRECLEFILSKGVMTSFSKPKSQKRKVTTESTEALPNVKDRSMRLLAKEVLSKTNEIHQALEHHPSHPPRLEQLHCLGRVCKRANGIARNSEYRVLGTIDTVAHACVLIFVLVWAQRLRNCKELWDNVMKYVVESGIDQKCQAAFPKCMDMNSSDDSCRMAVISHVTLLTAVWKYGSSQPINKNFLISAFAALFRCNHASLTAGKSPSPSMKIVQEYWDSMEKWEVYPLIIGDTTAVDAEAELESALNNFENGFLDMLIFDTNADESQLMESEFLATFMMDDCCCNDEFIRNTKRMRSEEFVHEQTFL